MRHNWNRNVITIQQKKWSAQKAFFKISCMENDWRRSIIHRWLSSETLCLTKWLDHWPRFWLRFRLWFWHINQHQSGIALTYQELCSHWRQKDLEQPFWLMRQTVSVRMVDMVGAASKVKKRSSSKEHWSVNTITHDWRPGLHHSVEKQPMHWK